MSALFDKTQYFTNCFTIHSKDMDFSFTVCQNSAFRSFFGIRNNKFTDRTRAIRTFRVKKNIKERVVRGEKNISQRTQVRKWIEQAAQVIAGKHKWKMARRSSQCTFLKCSSPTYLSLFSSDTVSRFHPFYRRSRVKMQNAFIWNKFTLSWKFLHSLLWMDMRIT